LDEFSFNLGGAETDHIMKHAINHENAREFFEPVTSQSATIGAAVQTATGDPFVLDELVKVLSPHPGGLRRFSVMRAIRALRDRSQRPVSLKFEAEIERAFRSSCANWAGGKVPDSSNTLFYRPDGKAGEVWAVHADRAKAWLAGANDL
jgi:hypothetical protein